MKLLLRCIFALFFIALVTLATLWLAQHPGRIETEWLGYRISASLSTVLGVPLILLLVSALVTLILTGTVGQWQQRRLRRLMQKREAGMESLTRSIVALSTGDLRASGRYHEKALRQLGQAPLVQLVGATLARRQQNAPKLESALRRMLDAPSTQPLAAMALAAEAKHSGQLPEAAAYIEQAEKNAPLERGTAVVLIDIYHRQQRWAEAEALLVRAQKKQSLSEKEVRYYRAVLQLLQAQIAIDRMQAYALHLSEAYRADPTFLPAVIALAEHRLAEDPRQARRLIRSSWRENPHPELAKIYLASLVGLSPRARQAAIQKLAARAPSHLETQLLLANAAQDVGNMAEARTYYQTALGVAEQMRIYQQLAKLEQKQGHMDAAAEWLTRATAANASPAWRCESCGESYKSWQPVCDACDSFATIAWESQAEGIPAAVNPLERGLMMLDERRRRGARAEA